MKRGFGQKPKAVASYPLLYAPNRDKDCEAIRRVGEGTLHILSSLLILTSMPPLPLAAQIVMKKMVRGFHHFVIIKQKKSHYCYRKDDTYRHLQDVCYRRNVESKRFVQN